MADERASKRFLREGIAFARANKDDDARVRLVQAARLNPRDAEVWFWLGLVLDDPDKQLQCMQRALELNPDHARAREAVQTLTAAQGTAAIPPPLPAPSPPTPTTSPWHDMDDATAESDPFSAPVEAASQELTPMDDRPAVQGGPRDGRYRRDEGIVTPLFGTPVEEIQELAAETASIEPPPVRERPRLIRAWLAALVFDGERAYEAYRGRTDPIIAALMTAFAVALALLVSTVVPLLSLLGEFAAGDLLRFLGESFVRALLMAAQVVLALFIAAWVASYIGRKRFGSEVGAVELFSLSGLFYAPASLLFVALTLLTTVAANALGAAATTPAAYTLFVFFVYLVGGVVYSNAVIHRVPAWPAAIISTAALLAAGLVLVWLLPLTAPLRAP